MPYINWFVRGKIKEIFLSMSISPQNNYPCLLIFILAINTH